MNAQVRYCAIEVLQARAHVQVRGKPHILMVRGLWQAFGPAKGLKAMDRHVTARIWCDRMNGYAQERQS